MKTVSARQANHEFSDLLSRVERGEEILITKRSKCRTSQNRGSLYETEMERTKPRSRCGGTGLAVSSIGRGQPRQFQHLERTERRHRVVTN